MKKSILQKKNNRDYFIKIRVNEEDKNLIESKFRNSDSHNESDFIRTMIFEGAILKFDEKKLQEITRNINGASANVNQIAVRVNSTGSIYADDVENRRNNYQNLMIEFLRLKGEISKITAE